MKDYKTHPRCLKFISRAVQPYILILNTDSTLEDGRIEGRKATFQKEKTKGTVSSYVKSRDAIGWLVAEAAATVDLLLRSMGLKYFNRHGLYGMATLADAQISTFRPTALLLATFFFRLFLHRPRLFPSSTCILVDQCGAHRSLKPLFAVIARNHTRGHYENDSADAYFFSLFLLPVRSLSRPFSPLVTRFRLAPRPYDTLLRFGNVSGHEVRDSPGMPILFNVFISESGEQFASGKLFRQLPFFFCRYIKEERDVVYTWKG